MPESSSFVFSIAASFTAEPLESVIGFWSEPLHSRFETNFASFGQVAQTVLDPGSIFAANRHGVNVLLFRWADLGETERRAENVEALRGAVAARAANFQVPLLVVSDEELGPEWNDITGVYVLGSAQVDRWYPVMRKQSARGEKLGAIPYTEEYFVALGTALVRAAHAVHKGPHKVLALDCDQTLWQGICGEDGPEGVKLTPGHEALQRFAVRQREAGMLLALVSKNNAGDVIETFVAHPEFPLRLEAITAQRVDWRPKAEGLASLAKELSLGLDSFVFLDDNEREVSEVDEQLPEVLALQLPEDAAGYGEFLEHVWAFDRLKTTAADAGRAASYESVQEFGKALHAAGSLEDFYRTLELEVEIRAVRGEEVARAAQLTQRTNQFNFTTRRRTEAEIEGFLREGWEVLGVHVRDRFGDYGFTGLVLGERLGRELRLDTFLLSCRILGRGVEHEVMRWLGGLDVDAVEIEFAPSAKNAPAAEFYSQLKPRMTTGELRELRFGTAVEVVEARPAVVARAAEHSVDYGRIARELRTVAAIRERMRNGRTVKLETETETRLARIWQELLECDVVSGESNFFELGGHSLKVVLLLMRIEEEFGVGLGIEDVYAAEVRLEKMARRVDELVAFGGVGHEEYTRILQEIEAMTEEEAAAALGEEMQVDANSARG